MGVEGRPEVFAEYAGLCEVFDRRRTAENLYQSDDEGILLLRKRRLK